MLTEFGSSLSPLNVTAPTELADDHLMSWFHWDYPFWKTPNGPGSAGPTPKQQKWPCCQPPDVVESHLERPYAQATAGTPLSQHFDPVTGAFSFVFRPDPAIDAPTSIVIPARQYVDGYTTDVTGGAVTSPPQSGTLAVTPDPDAPTVTVIVRREG